MSQQGKASFSQEEPGQNGPDKEQLEKSISVAKKVVEAQKTAESLKERAMKAVNPKERMRLLQEAYHKEIEAHGQSKYAKRLQSGVWQGGTAGGGIGAGIAMGVGAVTGTLISGLVSLPTVLLGGLVGAGTGAIHGPFIKLGGSKKDDKATSDEEVRAQAMKEAEALDQAVEKGATSTPKPPDLEEGIEEDQQGEVPGGLNEEAIAGNQSQDGADMPPKKKPRKLQVRAVNEVSPASQERRKPRKLEVRTALERQESV